MILVPTFASGLEVRDCIRHNGKLKTISNIRSRGDDQYDLIFGDGEKVVTDRNDTWEKVLFNSLIQT